MWTDLNSPNLFLFFQVSGISSVSAYVGKKKLIEQNFLSYFKVSVSVTQALET